MPIIKSSFKPAWWLANPHLQTLWSSFFRSLPEIDLHNIRLELDDGDFLDLVVTDIQDKPLVIILHGLEGSLESHYIKPLIKTLDDAGYGVCFVHFRGCSEELNRLPRSYHSGDTADLQTIVQYMKNNYKQGVFAVIGFSLGGNIVLKWLGEQGAKAITQTAIAISVPFTLSHAGERLEKSFSRVYQKHLLTRCQKKYKQKSSLLKMPIEADAQQLNTFYTFDDQITAPLHGFKNADDYYQQCSSRQFLKDIKKPTLILHAKDDPFMWEYTVPNDDELSSSIKLELSDTGGHVGFIAGKNPFNPLYWVDQRIVEWLDSPLA
ncbi:MAG TPA: hydrolase [Leucothrix sp.]|nr:hydrolase [Leucothrix sp.]HIQ14670.1 hydrolase [Leucothrix sp.]